MITVNDWVHAQRLSPVPMNVLSSPAVAAAARPFCVGRTPSCRSNVITRDVRRSKQYIARKELQKRSKQEYLRRIYETADRVEDERLVFELQPSSPRVRAELQAADQHAALNQQLAQQIPQLTTWAQLQGFVQQHGEQLNFLNVVALVTRAAALQQAAASAGEAQHAPHDPLVPQLTLLVLQHSSWFQPVHFAASAVALADLGVTDAAVWDNLTAAAQHKVGAFTFPQLTATLEALAAAGYTPELSWVERSYRQASKHLHAAEATDIAVLLGAWGEFGYTPRDRLFMNQVKITTRRAFEQGQLSGAELVQLLHGLARMPRYAPNQGWLAAAAEATLHHLQGMTPGAVVDLLLSFVALDFTPPEPWMAAALGRLQQAMTAHLAQQQHSGADTSSNSPGSPPQQQQHEPPGLLFLPPLDLQQLAEEQLLMSPALLVDPLDQASSPQQQQQQQQQSQQLPVNSSDMADLQALFEEADLDAIGTAGEVPQQSLQQQQGSSWNPSSTAALHQPLQQQPSAGDGDLAQRVPRLASSSPSSSSAHSLRWQLLQPGLAPEHLGVLCWCLGRLQVEPSGEWMQLLGRVLLAAAADPAAAPPAAPALRQEVLVDVLLGCVATGYLPTGPLQQLLLAQVLQCIPSMPPEGLRRTCQALVGLESGLGAYQQQPAALAMLLQQQQSVGAGTVAEGTAADSSSSSILEPLLQQKDEIAAAVMLRQGIILTGSSTAQLADVLAFLAAAGSTPSLDYMTAAVTRAVDKLPDGCPTPVVCTLLWALARMGFKPHPQLLHQLLAALQRGLHRLSSQDLADAGWALCTLHHRPGNAWLSLYLKEVAAKAPFMRTQALTDTLWALACFAAQPDREWLKGVVALVGSRASAGDLSRQNAAVVLWALQQLGFQPDKQVAAAGGAAAAGATPGAVAALVAVVQAA